MRCYLCLNSLPTPGPRPWPWAGGWPECSSRERSLPIRAASVRGKTAFTEGLAEGLGCTDPVSSPTFAIVNYYRGPRPLAHFDLYRISTENDLCAAGFYDYLDQGAIVAAEWSENFADLLALENPIRVDIQRVDENTRRITIGGNAMNILAVDTAGKTAGVAPAAG